MSAAVRPRRAGRYGSAGSDLALVTRATRFGRPLPDGGTIGVAAAASPYDSRSDVLRGVEWWEARGYRVKLGAGVWERDDYVAGDARQRADDLNALFADPEVDVVQALQGGFGSAQVVPYLDFDLISENPKPLVGFSDLTALHVALLQKSGLATIYANGLMGVGSAETSKFTQDRLLEVLRSGGAGRVPRDPDDPWVRTIGPGKVTAPLVGGCLWLLMQTLGTPWEIEFDGAILFFEDTYVPPYYVDGQLVQLAHAGKLDRVAGVVVGQMEKCDWGDLRPVSDWARSRSIEDVLEERLGALGVPVIYGLPLGHGKHLAALPLGVVCTLDADARTLTVDEPALR
jgi:muramoyltetrapeptide carboxypeptidase